MRSGCRGRRRPIVAVLPRRQSQAAAVHKWCTEGRPIRADRLQFDGGGGGGGTCAMSPTVPTVRACVRAASPDAR